MRIGLALVMTCIAATSGAAQQPAKKCSGSIPDTVALGGPVYRDCDVQRAAAIRGRAPRLDLRDFRPDPRDSRDACYTADLEFIVDTTGAIEQSTVKSLPGNHVEMDRAVRAQIKRLLYQPAVIEGKSVRQLVLYEKRASYEGKVPFTVGGGGGGGLADRPPPSEVSRC